MSEAEPLAGVTRQQLLWLLGSLLVAGWLVWLLQPVLTPFFVAFLIAYLVNPVVSLLERAGLRRDLAVGLVFFAAVLALALMLLLIVPLLVRESADFFARLPGYLETVQARVLPWLEETFGLSLSLEAFDAERLRELFGEYFQSVAGMLGATLAAIGESGGRFLLWLTGIVLIPLVTFYLLRDWDRLLAVLGELLPRNIEPTVQRLTRDCDEALGGFLRGQLMVMLSLGVIYATGLWLVGLNNGIAIGMIAGIISFVPYLGATVGVLLAGITAVVQSDTSLWFYLAVALVFVVGQLIESFVLTPKLVGDRIGLHPVLVIFTVMAGGHLFGFTGILLALPVAAAATVLVRFAYAQYRASELYANRAGRAEAPD